MLSLVSCRGRPRGTSRLGILRNTPHNVQDRALGEQVCDVPPTLPTHWADGVGTQWVVRKDVGLSMARYRARAGSAQHTGVNGCYAIFRLVVQANSPWGQGPHAGPNADPIE